jgi:phosphopantothenoylcysteine decarboxylase/phosphopantothenate--cysteine ligase
VTGPLSFSGFLGSRVHLGVTGSVAAYKALDLLRLLTGAGCSVSATLTESARRFVTPLSFQALGADPVFGGMFKEGENPFGHLAPGKTAQAMVIAPASANTLARLANGLADDMLSCQALAFPGPLILAPAMNPNMWAAPATRENWTRLLARGVRGVEPEAGPVACGDQGQGRLAALSEIQAAVLRALAPQDMAGKRVLVSLGPTREAWDPVRFWSNASSGLMGASLAVAAWLRGAEVTAVAGPAQVELPRGLTRVNVTTAAEMHAACLDLWPRMDVACMTAAVSDFRPEPYGDTKFKKDKAADGLTIRFLANADILKDMGARKKKGQVLVGFAAETSDLETQARAKLKAKHLDMVVANRVDLPDSGFGGSNNTVCVLDRRGRLEHWTALPKTEVAWRIWDLLPQL